MGLASSYQHRRSLRTREINGRASSPSKWKGPLTHGRFAISRRLWLRAGFRSSKEKSLCCRKRTLIKCLKCLGNGCRCRLRLKIRPLWPMLVRFAALGDRMSVAPQGETYAKGASRLPLVFLHHRSRTGDPASGTKCHGARLMRSIPQAAALEFPSPWNASSRTGRRTRINGSVSAALSACRPDRRRGRPIPFLSGR
jgi:hypothetical protein